MPDLKDIERDLVHDRNAMRAQVRSLSVQLRQSDLADHVLPALRSRTVPLALTGIGISWFAAQMMTTRAAPRVVARYHTTPTPHRDGLPARGH